MTPHTPTAATGRWEWREWLQPGFRVREGTTLVRNGRSQVIGEVLKTTEGWKAYTGYDIPSEFRGTWSRKTDAVAAVHEGDRLYRAEYGADY